MAESTENSDSKPQQIHPSSPLVVSPEECNRTPPVIDIHHVKEVEVEPFVVPVSPLDG